jgi:hypothetical protein
VNLDTATHDGTDDGFGDDENDVDAEYGGRLRDDNDPFARSGALDPTMAIQKKH